MSVEELIERLSDKERAALFVRIAELRTEISELNKVLSKYRIRNYELNERLKNKEEQETQG